MINHTVRTPLDDFSLQREQMVEEQLSARNITDSLVLEAMREIPRHLFTPLEYQQQAYTDNPLPIGWGQTISQPYIVALMTQMLELKGSEKILEIGTGSGYQAAVLAHLAAKVYTIERHANLAKKAISILTDLDIKNVEVILSDGSLGLDQYSPYDGILVTAAAPQTPRPLLNQLAEGGRLVIPIGSRWSQTLQIWTRKEKTFQHNNISPVVFVPLRGKHGWSIDEWEETENYT